MFSSPPFLLGGFRFSLRLPLADLWYPVEINGVGEYVAWTIATTPAASPPSTFAKSVP
uniref:Uncharacterized protein n=1 Tax=Arundo donax TaxID=35708 RepID=A0A0A8YJZ7_ARUDO